MAQNATTQEVETLTRTIIYGNSDEAVYATSALFRKKADSVIESLLQRQDISRNRRLEILRALKVHGRDRAAAACQIVRQLIMAEDQDFQKQARNLIVSMEPLSGSTPGPIAIKGTSYGFLQQALLEFVANNLDDQNAAGEANVLLDLLTSKQDPVAATKVLIDILKALRAIKGSVRATRYSHEVERALETVTGVTNIESWENWFRKEQQRSRTAWLMRRIERMKSSHISREQQLENVAATVFRKLVKALKADQRAQLSELQTALRQTPVEAIRLQAVELLGELATSKDIGEECVETLTNFLKQQNPSESMKNAAYKALGASGRASAVAPLVSQLQDSSGKGQLVLIAALAKLKNSKSIAPLKALLSRQLKTEEPDTAKLLKIIQALEQIGQDPSGKISSALIEIVSAVRTNRWKKLSTEDQRNLLQANAAALGRLDYEVEATAQSAAKTLQTLMDSPDSAVRFFVADSLSRLKFVDVRKPLEKLANDAELSVRQAAVQGLGRWALLPRFRDQRRDVVTTLVTHFISSDNNLHKAARTALTNLINDEVDNPIGNLVIITESLEKRERIDLAHTFLQRLDKKKVQEVKVQWLFEARARAALKRSESLEDKAKAALLKEAQADIDFLMNTPGANAKPRLRRLKSRVFNIQGQVKEAALAVINDTSLEESWTLFLKYLKELKAQKLDDQLKEIVTSVSKKGLKKEQLDQLQEFSGFTAKPAAKTPTKSPKAP